MFILQTLFLFFQIFLLHYYKITIVHNYLYIFFLICKKNDTWIILLYTEDFLNSLLYDCWYHDKGSLIQLMPSPHNSKHVGILNDRALPKAIWISAFLLFLFLQSHKKIQIVLSHVIKYYVKQLGTFLLNLLQIKSEFIFFLVRRFPVRHMAIGQLVSLKIT